MFFRFTALILLATKQMKDPPHSAHTTTILNEFRADQEMKARIPIYRNTLVAIGAATMIAASLLVVGAGVAGVGTANPPNTEIIFPDRKIQTKGSWAKVGFYYGCTVDDSLGENTCDYFECKLDGRGFKRCPGGASDPGAGVTYWIRATRSWRTHVFSVRVTDTNGKTDPTPAKWRFRVRRYGPRQAFSGVWKARDRDGSRQWVRFSGAGNRRTVKYRDSSSSVCQPKGPETVWGKGRIKGQRLIGRWTAAKCTKSGEKTGGAGKLSFRWRRSTNTLKNNWGSVWKRKR